MLSSGSMTNRLDRLEKAGFVKRLPDPKDRRGTLIQLTDKGLQLIDRAVEVHLRNELRLIANLSVEERKQLTHIFSYWLQSFEPPIDSESEPG